MLAARRVWMGTLGLRVGGAARLGGVGQRVGGDRPGRGWARRLVERPNPAWTAGFRGRSVNYGPRDAGGPHSAPASRGTNARELHSCRRAQPLPVLSPRLLRLGGEACLSPSRASAAKVRRRFGGAGGEEDGAACVGWWHKPTVARPEGLLLTLQSGHHRLHLRGPVWGFNFASLAWRADHMHFRSQRARLGQRKRPVN
jgi:hypothetical protein